LLNYIYSFNLIISEYSWNFETDSFANERKNSLNNLGYWTCFKQNQDNIDGKYLTYSDPVSSHGIVIKEIDLSEIEEDFYFSLWIGIVMGVFLVLVIGLSEYKLISFFWKYRRNLSPQEVTEINQRFIKLTPAKFFILFIPKTK